MAKVSKQRLPRLKRRQPTVSPEPESPQKRVTKKTAPKSAQASPKTKPVSEEEPVSVKRKPRASQNETLSIAQVDLVDYNCYCYASLILLQGNGLSEDELEAGHESYQQELTQGTLLEQAMERNRSIHASTRKRALIVNSILVAEKISKLTQDFEQVEEESGNPAEAIYQHYSQLAAEYEKIISFLDSSALDPTEKISLAYFQLYLDLKTHVFTCKISGGHEVPHPTKGSAFSKKEANAVLLDVFDSLGPLSLNNPAVNRMIKERISKISTEISTGEICQENTWLAVQEQLYSYLVPIFRHANALKLPTMKQYSILENGPDRPRSRLSDSGELPNGSAPKNRRKTAEDLRDEIGPGIYNMAAENPLFRLPFRRNVWSEEETEALRQGMLIYGCGWAKIIQEFPILSGRTGVALKDRARNVKSQLRRKGEDLGIWVIATG